MKIKQKKNKTFVDKSMTFAEILQKYPAGIEVLLDKGMHCVGCHMAIHETLEQGAIMHGLDSDDLVKKMNEKIAKSEKLLSTKKTKKKK